MAARKLSFRLASEELNVTASAVSHQIKSLEDELNTTLFVRTGRNLELTPTGAQLHRELGPLIDEVDTVMARYKAPSSTRQLRISVQPFFASEMFVPELEAFTAQHPHLEIYVDTSDESSELHPPNMDASIRLFRKEPVHLTADCLFPLMLVPACSPSFLARFEDSQAPESVAFPVILHSNRPHAWRQWERSAGIKLQEPSATLVVDSMIAVARAAERGLGAALVPVPLSENWFRYGALVPLFDHVVEMEDKFYFVSRGEVAPEVDSLRAWTLEKFGAASDR